MYSIQQRRLLHSSQERHHCIPECRPLCVVRVVSGQYVLPPRAFPYLPLRDCCSFVV